MKISSSMDHAISVKHCTYYEAACIMKKAGFDGVDLNLTRNQMEPEKILLPEWEAHARDMADSARRAGLEIAQCHLPYYPGHIDLPGDGSAQAFEDFMLPGYIRALEVCDRINCRVAVLHPFFDINSRENTHNGNLHTLNILVPVLEKYGIRLALENVYGPQYANAFVSYPDEILALIRDCGSKAVGACLDTGHANIFRINVADMARQFGDRLYALHVNGNAGKDEHVIPYTMSSWAERIDYYALSQTLKEIGYQGFYNMELSNGPMPEEVIQAYYDYSGAMARALANRAQA